MVSCNVSLLYGPYTIDLWTALIKSHNTEEHIFSSSAHILMSVAATQFLARSFVKLAFQAEMVQCPASYSYRSLERHKSVLLLSQDTREYMLQWSAICLE